MPNNSFAQTSFRGGVWSPLVQGRFDDPRYKEGLNASLNGLTYPAGPWTRRPGTRYIAHTRGGATAKLIRFDYEAEFPYQIEFTAGKARFFQGLSPVFTRSITTREQAPTVAFISDEAQAVVQLAQNMPTGWANGDTIVFDFKRVPCSAPALCGRQFTISDIDAPNRKFKIKDALTGAYVSGVGLWLDYSPDEAPTVDADEIGQQVVYKVHELDTPYLAADLPELRAVKDIAQILLLHPNYAPRLISATDASSIAPFQIAVQDFSDGPYLEQNTTATTLALSGTSGSVTVTASSIVGINAGLGFQTTDVGRVIRFASGAPSWSSLTTYATAARVLASDGNIYTAVKGGNLNNDPATDDGTWWEISTDTVRWTWLRITARSSTTVVTATILGPNAQTTTATATWRLGLFSNTTGWPKVGTFHEGRLWLVGASSNRVDASKAGGIFNFSPTASDGTVADDNAIAATADADENNAFHWLHSTGDGLILGSLEGEWRVRASSLDDPLSPFTVQMRRVSSYGCADVDPVDAGNLVFVQRQQRRLLNHIQAEASEYRAEDISEKYPEGTVSGIAEIVWHQEPFQTIWVRREDGQLYSCYFRLAPPRNQTADDTVWSDNATGWHQHSLGSGRTAVSLSAGTAPDGLSDTLYMVTKDDANVHFLEMMRPSFDPQQEGWAGAFVDAGGELCCIQVKKINRGDTFDGVRIWGLWHLNGKTIVPVCASLDLGDRVVSNGYVDVPFLSDPAGLFTEAYLTAENGGDYGGLAAFATNWYVAYTAATAGPNQYQMAAFVGPDGTVTGSYDGYVLYECRDDLNEPITYQLQDVSGLITAGLRVMSSDDGTVIANVDEAFVMNGVAGASIQGGVPVIFMQDADSDKKYLVTPVTGSNSRSWGKIEVNSGPNQYKLVETYGAETSTITPDGSVQGTGDWWAGNTHVPSPLNSVAPLRCGITTLLADEVGRPFTNGFAYFGLSSAGEYRNCIMMFVGEAAMGVINIVNVATPVNNPHWDVCTGVYGPQPLGTFLAVGHPVYGAASPVGWTLARGFIRNVAGLRVGGLNKVTTDNRITPSLVDAAWTNFSDFYGIMFDQYDNDPIMFFTTTDAVTNQHYLAKWGIDQDTFKWKIAIPFNPISCKDEQHCAVQEINGEFCVLLTGLTPGIDKLYKFDTINGTFTTIDVNPNHLVGPNQLWDPKTASITSFGSYSDGGSPDPVLVGPWLGSNPPPFSNKYHRIWFSGFTYPEKSVLLSSEQYYDIPATAGFTYTSRGQILPSNFGNDPGNAAGPAFAKKRRNHWYALGLYRTRGLSVGANFSKVYPVKFLTPGGTPIAAPALITGTVTDTVHDDYSFDGALAWEVTRPYNVTITVVSGYSQAQDK